MRFRLHQALPLLAFLAGVVPVWADDAPACLTNISARAPVGGPAGDAWLVNLSTRAPVGGVAGTPITGFVFTGLERPIVIRGVGPTLADFGVSAFMADPRLNVVSGGLTIAGNEDWSSADLAAMAAVGAFPLLDGSRDAALVN